MEYGLINKFDLVHTRPFPFKSLGVVNLVAKPGVPGVYDLFSLLKSHQPILLMAYHMR